MHHNFQTITQEVNCKINIGLQILRKRSDGYHDIQTIFYPTHFFTDKLTIESHSHEFDFECNSQENIGKAEDNLCVKAFRLLQANYGIEKVKITLDKHIPVGAGLGGGSADAAFTLKMLAAAFHLPATHQQLQHYAAKLGSDVAFFIDNAPVYATGRGEIMEPLDLDLSDHQIRIWKPDFAISTRDAYADITPKETDVYLPDEVQRPITEWNENIHNDFETSILHKYPELRTLKENIYAEGALYASMTGSGTAMYGIF